MLVMKKLTTRMMTVATTLLLTISCLSRTTCEKLEDEVNALYETHEQDSYKSFSTDFDYQDACGPFDTAIRFSVGLEPIMGGADGQVKEACDACYENLKTKLQGRSGKVVIFKTRRPDGRQKILKEYKF